MTGMREHRLRRLVLAGALVLLIGASLLAVVGFDGEESAASEAGTDTAETQRQNLTSPIPAPPDNVQPARAGLARAAVTAAEGAAARSTQLAVAVLDRETGEVATGRRGDEPYYTASLAKLVVAVDVLDRRRLEGLVVTDEDLALFRRALGPSDDAAMNALWMKFDGNGAAGRVAGRLGLRNTSAPQRFGQWGEMDVSAADHAKLWGYVLDDMPAADRDVLVSAMAAAPPTAKDGFDQAFGLLSPAVTGPGGPGAVAKQGWMCCFSGQYYLHSAGAVGADQRFVVTLLTRQPRGPGWEAARTQATAVATAAVRALE
jgi:hypothetical protein